MGIIGEENEIKRRGGIEKGKEKKRKEKGNLINGRRG